MTPCIMMDAESSAATTFVDDPLEASPTTEQTTKDLKRRHRHLSRLVSQEEINTKKSKTEAHTCSSSSSIPHLPDPLQNPRLLQNHVAAVRLEADLYPLRLILSRLMFHPIHNRKCIFNRPVDPVSLGLPDYEQIIKRPMDLGTIKRKLHAIAYRSRKEAVQDIRLVFTNAITYNPPLNLVHISARELLSYFDTCCASLDPPVSDECNIPPDGDDMALETSVTLEASQTVSQPSEATEVAALSSVVSASAATPTPSLPDSVNLAASAANGVQDPPTFQVETAEKNMAPANPMVASSTPIQDKHVVSTRAAAPQCQAVGTPLLDYSTTGTPQSMPQIRVPKRRASFTRQGSAHNCQQCEGRTCTVCRQGCLQHEPALLVCCGAQCAGSKIRKNGVYYTTRDGIHQICDRCFPGLPSTVPPFMQSETCRYKQDLLRRRNDEEIAEEWINCSQCTGAVHVICAMHNGYVHDQSQFKCHQCRSSGKGCADYSIALDKMADSRLNQTYTYVSGFEAPVPLETFRDTDDEVLDSNGLSECPVSRFIEEKVQSVMNISANAGKTVSVRVISDCSRSFSVPKAVRRYFRMLDDSCDDPVVPPASVQYRQKAIVMFQKIDGLDVCVFCMYVQEYDGDSSDEKRVYIAYIDSVEHFRPRELRTEVFHEILVAYLATARERGFKKAHIWACPPSRGNCFVFWNHPLSQRVPTADRLQSWYRNALSRGIDAGVVVDVKSLYESDFEQQMAELVQDAPPSDDASFHEKDRMLCPPLIDGDFWIEEAVRLHQCAIDRNLRVRSPTEVCVWNVGSRLRSSLSPCPALQVATLLKDRIMTHPSSVPFRRPVNAAALKLKDYHKIVKTPIDLGTIYSRCILGEYHELRDVAHDVILMVANAKKFNPPGHIVNSMATEVLNLFNSELNALALAWGQGREENSWQAHDTTSMSLNVMVESHMPEASPDPLPEQNVVLIEDDRSFDGSKSTTSTITEASNVGAPQEKESSNAIPEREGVNTDESTCKPVKALDLHTDGPKAIMQKMAGKDVWLLNKRSTPPPKALKITSGGKRGRRPFGSSPQIDEPATKKRRQTWLCEEVGVTIRKMRTSFFACRLSPVDSMSETEEKKLAAYTDYVASFKAAADEEKETLSSLADTRSALLELSQFRNFEFDTLRRAKYSTSMLLYHIHHANAPGAIPSCTSCGENIKEVRWHKAKPIGETKQSVFFAEQTAVEPATTQVSRCVREDLCVACYEPRNSEEEFIPIPVSFQSGVPPS